MVLDLIPFISQGLMQKQAVDEIMKCNDYTAGFGLVIAPAQAVELVETRALALKDSGRIEFGGGVIDRIIKAFCDSPYIAMHNYTQTLHDLVELFYTYKNETMDLIPDDDLIAYMKTAYDGTCQGSLDLLAGRELYRLARNVRFGYDADYQEDDGSEEGADDAFD